jgi:hypothetical protein
LPARLPLVRVVGPVVVDEVPPLVRVVGAVVVDGVPPLVRVVGAVVVDGVRPLVCVLTGAPGDDAECEPLVRVASAPGLPKPDVRAPLAPVRTAVDD